MCSSGPRNSLEARKTLNDGKQPAVRGRNGSTESLAPTAPGHRQQSAAKTCQSARESHRQKADSRRLSGSRYTMS